jgi:hypothetical protein
VPDALVGAVGVTAQTSITTAAPANGGLAEEISKLAALRDQGVLTNEEFQGAKQAAITRGTRS